MYCGVRLQISTLIALNVCLIPTTIGGLLSAIGIAGMDRVTRFNVIAMSGKAVEACGDVDTMLLDKTGTITYGNRMAAKFVPVDDAKEEELIHYSVLSSLQDDTPEGKSVVKLGEHLSGKRPEAVPGAEFLEFTATTRMSGVDLPDGTKIRKGASDAVRQYVRKLGGSIPEDLEDRVNEVAKLGGTPLTVCVGNPLAMRGVKYGPQRSEKMLSHNMLVYGLGGIVVPFVGIKLIDLIIAPLLALGGM